MGNNTGQNKQANSAIEFVQWPVKSLEEENILEKKVFALQTTRRSPFQNDEGNSPYQHFNLGLHVGDCSEQVKKNRQSLQKLIPQTAKIQWLDQVHGNDVVEISEVVNHAIVADAAITRNKSTCLAIMTADCLPILLSNKQGTEIAAIHAGWRSLASGIISETLLKMLSENDEIHAWLGPCISQNNFEVGIEVKHQFEQINQSLSKAFRINDKSPHQNKWLGGLQQIAQQQLIEQGVVNIATNKHCTFGENERYYSYRKEQLTGRMAAVICIK